MKKDMLFFDETLFMNPEVFDFDYVPEEFMFRMEQMQEIASCLRPAINKKRPVNCMLNGAPSTGKTTSIKKIFEEMDGYNHIVKIHLNCRVYNTTFRVYSEIHKKIFGYTLPESGVSVTSIYQKIFDYLTNEKKILIISLDDCVFLEDCDEVIYQLSRASEVFEGVKVGLIAVLSEKEKYIIEDKAESVFRPMIIDYSSYNEDEVFDILKVRAEIGFYRGVIDEEVLRNIAEYSIEKDLRFGLELLRQSGIEAENKSNKKILKQHVKNAFNKICKIDKDLGKQELNEKEKIVLQILSSNRYGSGDLYELFGKKIKISYSSFYRLIDKMSKKKLISVEEKEGKDGKGRTRIIRKL